MIDSNHCRLSLYSGNLESVCERERERTVVPSSIDAHIIYEIDTYHSREAIIVAVKISWKPWCTKRSSMIRHVSLIPSDR